MAAPMACFLSRTKILKTYAFSAKHITEISMDRYKTGLMCRSCLILKRQFGQPASKTHPHLINVGEVTPGIDVSEFQQRRKTFLETIKDRAGNNIKNHMAIFPSSSKVYMSYDIPYPFRQNTEFLYLSGFQEPDSVLLMQISENESKSMLFVPKRDPDKELWDGPRSGDTGAQTLTGVTEAYNIDQLEKYLYEYCKTHSDYLVWYNMTKPVHVNFHKSVINEFLKQEGLKSVQNPNLIVQQMRLIKSEAEIELMKKTTAIASEAFIDVMRESRPGINEAHLYAKMDYECRVRGAEILAYPPVVAGGDRANIIHYINNNQLILDGEMVLMDAGCEYHGYTSDITRTWPVSGRFSTAQRKLYTALLEVQEILITMCETNTTLSQLYRAMMQLLADKLAQNGLIPHAVANDEHKLKKLMGELCPHDVGHYLGMDVHDTALVSKNIPLQPGMVITIEPGLYIKADNMSLPKEYRGIGIRIEDNVLITKSTPVVLTKNCPKYPDDIENIMAIRG